MPRCRSPTRSRHAANAQQAGGNRVQLVDHLEEDTRQQAADEIWVRRIKAALMENRFRLMQQPIASLLGGDRGMYDVLVRMIDEQGQELLPAEFMAAAERNDLMKNIDRWIIGAAMSVCASRKVEQLFVRLSKDSMRDKSLLQWLANQLKASRIDPSHIVFQISEQIATEYLADATELAAGLRKAGFLFAIEHFGTGRDPAAPARASAAQLRQGRRHPDAGPGGRSGPAAARPRLRRPGPQPQASAPSPNASKTRTPWRCCGSSASSSFRATSSTNPNRS